MSSELLEVHIPKLPDDLERLQHYIRDRELSTGTIKPDNEARIVWTDSAYQKTEYSIVYLHGFSASHGEGNPVHRKLAISIKANLYLSRLDAHGLNGRSFSTLTPQSYLNSAVQAIEIGKKLGEKCIVMGSSTGGTLALYLAGILDGIHALMLYSPLIDFAQKNIRVLKNKPLSAVANIFFPGMQISRIKERSEGISKYWYEKYSFKGVLSLFSLVSYCNTIANFQKVTQPVFLGYYYKSETLQDPTVSVSAMLDMIDNIGTNPADKRKISYPDAGSHVLTSSLTTSVYDEVFQDSLAFFHDIIKPKSA